jgi:hypothetical protein
VTAHRLRQVVAGFRQPVGKQWRCSCGWAGTVVMYESVAAHHQAELAAVRHASLNQDEEPADG